MKANTNNQNIINYTYIKNLPVKLLLSSPKEEGNTPIDFINRKKELQQRAKVIKKLPFERQSIKLKKGKISKCLLNLKEKIYEMKLASNLKKEAKYEKIKSKNIYSNSLFHVNKLDDIYSLLFSRNPFQKLNKYFDLDKIKRDYDTQNRNIEKNRLKEHLKRAILDGKNVQSIVAQQYKEGTEDLDILQKLAFESNIMMETLYSNLPTTMETRENIRTENIQQDVIIDTLNNKESPFKNKTVFSSRNNENLELEKNAISKITVTSDGLTNKDSSDLLNLINRAKAKRKKYSHIDYTKKTNKESSEFIKIKENITNIPTFQQIKNNDFEYKLKLKPTSIRKKEKFSKISKDSMFGGDGATTFLLSRKNADENIKTELKSEDEFNREHAKEYKKILFRIEREKTRFLKNCILEPADVMKIFKEKREIEIEKLKKRYLMKKNLFTFKQTKEKMIEKDKFEKLINAFESFEILKKQTI